MNHSKSGIISSLVLALTVVFFFSTSCEMQVDQDILIDVPNESFKTSLAESLSIMNDDPEGAIAQLDELIKAAKDESLSYYVGKALWYQAYIYKKKLDNISKAYFGYNEALKYLSDSEDFTLRAKISNNLAILYQYYEHHERAIDIYLEVLEYEDELEDKFVSDLYFNLGRSYKLIRTDESQIKAEGSFIKSLELAKAIEDHENIASVNNQVGMMYKDLADYDVARIAFKNTIRDYQNASPNSEVLEYVGQAYHGIGVTYMEQGKYDEAINSFREALKYKKDSESIFITKYDLGSVLFESNQAKEAIRIWQDALNEKHNKSERIQVEIYSKLTSALALHEDYEGALMYAQIYNDHIIDILSVGEKYKAENDRVLFADIIREYDEFNQVIPFYKEPWAISLMFLFIAIAVYAGSYAYYQSKLSTKVSDTRSEIQIEFQNIKID